ncbi:MAG: hypothetical protein JWN17_2558 [Frankiales bacterium]|nr:hypothetical protein [Frankiales bacterium]
MTLPARSVFDESLERSARHQQVQRWQAAQTVRAHVAVDAVDAMLECLGLEDAHRPEHG